MAPDLTPDRSGETAAAMLLEEFVRETVAWYRTTYPKGTLSDEALRAKALKAAARLEFDQLDNLAPGKALGWTAKGEHARAGRLLEQHYAQQKLLEKGQRASTRAQTAVKRLNQERRQTADEKQKKWRDIAAQLRRMNPLKSDRWLAAKVAAQTGDPASTIRKALSKSGASRKK
jgi:hypothetical protein